MLVRFLQICTMCSGRILFCSAGVGRTGTYIAVDTQLERARAEGVLDVYNTVRLMRQQRVNMVQSFVSSGYFIYIFPLVLVVSW